LCGSVYLNAGFENYIRMVLGDKFKGLTPKSRSRMMESWENDIKLRFGNSVDDEYELNVPNIGPNPEEGFPEQSWHMMNKYHQHAVIKLDSKR
jgi:hypothetical protein